MIRILFIYIITITNLYSQNATINGTVKESNTGKLLVGANVFLNTTSLGTATRSDGTYQISNVGPGKYILQCSYIGYVSKEVEIEIDSRRVVKINFELDYNTIQGEAIEVTAQARGQMDAINKQLKAKSIKNIISSDKIQELPDANAAEAVSRVPGVSIKREGGEGNKVVIRGLSPKYNKITVNGANLASTGYNDRSTDISMISQYMIEEIEVIKAGTPDLEADVLGGTVNFKLKKAPSGFHGNLITKGIYNGLEKASEDYKVVLGLSNRFYENKLGILVDLDSEKRNRGSHNIYANYTNMPAHLNTINPLRFTNLSLRHNNRLNHRLNSLVVLDYELENGFLSYSSLASSIKKNVNVYTDSYVLDGGRSVQYRTGDKQNTISIVNEIWKVEKGITENFNVDLFNTFSVSATGDTSKAFDFILDNAFIEDDVSKKNLEVIQGLTKKDTSAIYFSDYGYQEFKSKEKERSFGGNVEYKFNWRNQISGKFKMGYKRRIKSRLFDMDNESASFIGGDPLDQAMRDSVFSSFEWLSGISAGSSRIPYQFWMDSDYSDEHFLNGQFDLGPVADIHKMNQIFSFIRKNFRAARYPSDIIHSYDATGSLIYDYSGEEEYNAFYLMVDANIGEKLNIVTGLRNEKNKTTYQSYHGMRTMVSAWSTAGSDTISYHTRRNSFMLPSLFIKYDPTDWISLRYAKTNTLTRPDYSAIIPLYNIDGLSRAVVYRNPFLEAGHSNNNDYVLSFANNYLGLLSISYFTKTISGMIFNSGRRVATNPSEYGLPGFTYFYMIEDYKTNNPFDVSLNGFEIDFQTRLWYLPKKLRGLVFSCNYTRTYSKVKYPRTIIDHEIIFEPYLQVTTSNVDTFYVDRLLDQQKDIINYSIGYDYLGFSGRLSMNYISNIFSGTNFWPELRQDTDAYQRYDLSLKQKLPVKGLELFFNVNNIFEEVDIRRLRGFNLYDPDLSSSYYQYLNDQMKNNSSALEVLDNVPRSQRAKSSEQHYGRTIDLGFRYSF